MSRPAERSYVCAGCGAAHGLDAHRWRCDCGGLLDLTPEPRPFPADGVDRTTWSLWRYRAALPVLDRSPQLTMGEGMTSLVPLDPGGRVAGKLEYAMPTLSFKDRGAVVLVGMARQLGATRLVADSSGNAGTAIAAYATRAGLSCEVFVPATTSPRKLEQMRRHGAEVRLVEGSREDAAAAALAAVEAGAPFYASHVWNPWFFEGTKTFAYELWEQYDGSLPDVVVLPAGNGTLVLGTWLGFGELLASGLVDRLPRLVAVQAERCAPLAQEWQRRRADPRARAGAPPVAGGGDVGPPGSVGPTAAEGIAVAVPRRGEQVLAAVAGSAGAFVTVDEGAIAEAVGALAARGCFIEPTGAVPYAGWLAARAQGRIGLDDRVVLPLCGAGLKAL